MNNNIISGRQLKRGQFARVASGNDSMVGRIVLRMDNQLVLINPGQTEAGDFWSDGSLDHIFVKPITAKEIRFKI